MLRSRGEPHPTGLRALPAGEVRRRTSRAPQLAARREGPFSPAESVPAATQAFHRCARRRTRRARFARRPHARGGGRAATGRAGGSVTYVLRRARPTARSTKPKTTIATAPMSAPAPIRSARFVASSQLGSLPDDWGRIVIRTEFEEKRNGFPPRDGSRASM